jgi:5-methylcytosine-specific restriction enzyme A
MPSKPHSPCSQPGCPGIALTGGRCRTHARTPQPRPSKVARGYDREWQRIRAAQLRRQPECEMCGEPATDVDHILPLRKGGDNGVGNLQSLCKRCHSRKTAREDSGWGRP